MAEDDAGIDLEDEDRHRKGQQIDKERNHHRLAQSRARRLHHRLQPFTAGGLVLVEQVRVRHRHNTIKICFRLSYVHFSKNSVLEHLNIAKWLRTVCLTYLKIANHRSVASYYGHNCIAFRADVVVVINNLL